MTLQKRIGFVVLGLSLFSCAVRQQPQDILPQSGASPKLLLLIGPASVNVGECVPFKLTTANLTGAEQITPIAITATLSSGFNLNPQCQNPLAQTIVTAGTSSKTIYFQASTHGTVKISATDIVGKLTSIPLNLIVLPVVGLSISDGPTYNFGSAYLGNTLEKTFTLTNTGPSLLSALGPGAPALSAPFSFKGGVFPGSGGTCTNALEGKASCTTVLIFSPTSIGLVIQNLTIGFSDGAKINSVTRPMTGSGVTAGSTDPTFGSSGKVVTSTINSQDRGMAVMTQSDGKIVAVGSTLNNSTSYDTLLVRYNGDGSLDSSFGVSGIVSQALLTTEDRALAIVQQADGKYVTAGYGFVGTATMYLIARFNTNGSLDTSFGSNGKTVMAVGSGQDYAFSIALQADGKFVVGGYSYVAANSRYNMAIARFNSDGITDTSFGSGGKVSAAPGTGSSYCYGLAMQSDGKIVAVGHGAGVLSDIAAVRFNSDGSTDTSFGTNGITVVDVNNSIDYGYAVQIQTDGNIVIAGTSGFAGGSNFAAVRLTLNGSLDTTFNFTGKTFVPVGSSLSDARSIAIQSNGKIILGGFAHNGADYDLGFTRLFSDGAVDTAFGIAGKLIIALGTSDDRIFGMALDASGNIVAAGDTYQNGKLAVGLVRLLP